MDTEPLHSPGGKVRLKVAAHIVSDAGFDGPGIATATGWNGAGTASPSAARAMPCRSA
ncbi:hypothetical protein [Dankookia sp. P2]|uniref:hypothetical protein n=1 Tax=Dankookia sp. P2 TaxID=3423955 RepID=UPI003D66F07A